MGYRGAGRVGDSALFLPRACAAISRSRVPATPSSNPWTARSSSSARLRKPAG
jgi:hypothetical protein